MVVSGNDWRLFRFCQTQGNNAHFCGLFSAESSNENKEMQTGEESVDEDDMTWNKDKLNSTLLGRINTNQMSDEN